MIVVNNLIPVFVLILAGYFFKYFKLTDDGFLKTSDKLIYFIFFPILLFWKIGSGPGEIHVEKGFYEAVICTVFSVYILSVLFIKIFKVSHFQAGSFSQSCYRFNTYIGMAIMLTAMGEEGARQFGILIGVIIPIINVLAVSTLSWFSDEKIDLPKRLALVLKALISNPLILGCVAGILYGKLGESFPLVLENTFRLATLVTLPLALFSIGGTLTPKKMKNYFKLSLVSSVFKLVLLPFLGYLFFMAFDVSGTSFKVGMIFFSLPSSTAMYVLASQFKSDADLSSATIVLSTLLSTISLSISFMI
jgi:malonate transporter